MFIRLATDGYIICSIFAIFAVIKYFPTAYKSKFKILPNSINHQTISKDLLYYQCGETSINLVALLTRKRPSNMLVDLKVVSVLIVIVLSF